MVGDIEIGNDITERGCVKGKKEGAQDRTCKSAYNSLIIGTTGLGW